MYDRDSVIRNAAAAAAAHSSQVAGALAAYINAATPAELGFAKERLRAVLVAQAAGADGCHDGATRDARVSAAEEALAAWDGPAVEMCDVDAGGRKVRMPSALAYQLGWSTGRWGSYSDAPPLFLGALASGASPEDAAGFALAERARQTHALELAKLGAEAAANARAAAGMDLAAVRAANKK